MPESQFTPNSFTLPLCKPPDGVIVSVISSPTSGVLSETPAAFVKVALQVGRFICTTLLFPELPSTEIPSSANNAI